MTTAPEIETPEYTWDIARIFPPQGHWTEAAFLALPDSTRLLELRDGRLGVIEMPTDLHQRILGQLFGFIWQYLRRTRIGVVRSAGIRVRLRPGLIREPDIVFVTNAHADRMGEQVWAPPDLVVEIHSAGTRETDRVDKFREYAEAGIAEYWMVEPETETVEVYELRAGAYALRGAFRPGDTLTSGQLPGLDLPVAEVFAA